MGEFAGSRPASFIGKNMKEKVRTIFSRKERKTIVDKSLSRAAILLLFYQIEGKYYILFTKRTEDVEHHKGQISFPGGTYHDSDKTLASTALRESFEEIGVKEEDVDILGELDDLITVSSNYIVTPFIGTLPGPYKFEINENEVEEIIEVPLSALLDKDGFREGSWVHEGRSHPTYFYQYQEHTIWGATATILKQFLDLFFNKFQVLGPAEAKRGSKERGQQDEDSGKQT